MRGFDSYVNRRRNVGGVEKKSRRWKCPVKLTTGKWINSKDKMNEMRKLSDEKNSL
jgi:hypothetical protein